MASWYTICGQDHPHFQSWMAGLVALCVAGRREMGMLDMIKLACLLCTGAFLFYWAMTLREESEVGELSLKVTGIAEPRPRSTRRLPFHRPHKHRFLKEQRLQPMRWVWSSNPGQLDTLELRTCEGDSLALRHLPAEDCKAARPSFRCSPSALPGRV